MRKTAVVRNMLGFHNAGVVSRWQLARLCVLAHPYFPGAWPIAEAMARRLARMERDDARRGRGG